MQGSQNMNHDRLKKNQYICAKLPMNKTNYGREKINISLKYNHVNTICV